MYSLIYIYACVLFTRCRRLADLYSTIDFWPSSSLYSSRETCFAISICFSAMRRSCTGHKQNQNSNTTVRSQLSSFGNPWSCFKSILRILPLEWCSGEQFGGLFWASPHRVGRHLRPNRHDARTPPRLRFARATLATLAPTAACKQTHHPIFECCFPYVCPEPVLVNVYIFSMKWLKSYALSHLPMRLSP